MKVEKIFPPSKEILEKAWVKNYEKIYKESIENPERFWEKIARELHWFKPWKKVLQWRYPFAKWFIGAKCNIVSNALDRHSKTWRKNKVAIYWEGEDFSRRKLTYQELYWEVNRFANALKKLGVKKGDKVTLYLPRIPEQIIAMLACAKIGALHSVVYSGFSSGALKDRIKDAEAELLVTVDGMYYRGSVVKLKERVDEIRRGCPSLKHVVVVERIGKGFKRRKGDITWEEAIEGCSRECRTRIMDSEDPLFILYTSGTTGKPKGVVHVHGGYMVGAYITTKWIFDLKDGDVYWCTADPGWITGHTYITYGPLINGATQVYYEGAPNHPHWGRWWSIIERYGVTIFYTVPTAIRAMMRFDSSWPRRYDLNSLRLLGSVGEPLNPEAWLWFRKVIGNRLPIMDTWWMTETGMALITPLPCAPLKPGSVFKPFPGIQAGVVDSKGKEVPSDKGGYLVIKNPWPSMLRTIYKDPKRYVKTYWKVIPKLFFTGDIARRDEEGYFWVMGRSDDVIKTSGYRLGSAEIESALVSYPGVAEAAAIGIPDPAGLKGQVIKVFVLLSKGTKPSKKLEQELKRHVARVVGPIAVPAQIEFVDSLPKTRSGKIMRRLLRAKELGLPMGDLSVLED